MTRAGRVLRYLCNVGAAARRRGPMAVLRNWVTGDDEPGDEGEAPEACECGAHNCEGGESCPVEVAFVATLLADDLDAAIAAEDAYWDAREFRAELDAEMYAEDDQ